MPRPCPPFFLFGLEGNIRLATSRKIHSLKDTITGSLFDHDEVTGVRHVPGGTNLFFFPLVAWLFDVKRGQTFF